MSEYKYSPTDRKWEWYYTDEEIAARVAEYAARPDVQARWAEDDWLLTAAEADAAA